MVTMIKRYFHLYILFTSIFSPPSSLQLSAAPPGGPHFENQWVDTLDRGKNTPFVMSQRVPINLPGY